MLLPCVSGTLENKGVMKSFIATLIERYQSILEHAALSTEEQQETRSRLNSLRLAQGVLEKIELLSSYPQQPLQIGVLGPTQAGKSTLNNLLLGSPTAGVSALAGYTVHAQGFLVGDLRPEHHLDNVLSGMFPGYQQTPVTELDAQNYRQYSLTANQGGESGLQTMMPAAAQKSSRQQQPLVLWDSPDFDSIESGGYRTAVLRVAALSDVIILMLSKDKYADRSVWDMMKLLAPLNKPTVYVINKLNPEDLQTVSDSFRKRYAENISNSATTENNLSIVTLPYIRGLTDNAAELHDSGAQTLFENLSNAITSCDRANAAEAASQLIDQHWQNWLEPVKRELSAQQEWQTRVDLELERALQSYRTSYLDHPQKYDTFNRAIAELLTLLEIPGLAGTLSATRNVVTWPVRKLFGLGQTLINNDSSQAADQDNEKETLIRIQQKVISELQNLTMDNGGGDNTAWWLELNRELRSNGQHLQDSYYNEIDAYQKNFEPEIELAAQSLYKSLEKQPAVLNGLRAARVTTDAAAVVLAVKSGGLAASDLLIAPAMLSVTSMLTEGAVGKYMETVKQRLKEKQYERVENLLQEKLAPTLKQLYSQIEGDGVFGFEATQLADANEAKEKIAGPHRPSGPNGPQRGAML